MYAYYSMAQLAGCRLAYMTLDARDMVPSYSSYKAYKSYRGQLDDGQFMEFSPDDGILCKPIFQFGSAAEYFRARIQAVWELDVEWFYDVQRDQSFEGILAAFGAPPKPVLGGMEE